MVMKKQEGMKTIHAEFEALREAIAFCDGLNPREADALGEKVRRLEYACNQLVQENNVLLMANRSAGEMLRDISRVHAEISGNFAQCQADILAVRARCFRFALWACGLATALLVLWWIL